MIAHKQHVTAQISFFHTCFFDKWFYSHKIPHCGNFSVPSTAQGAHIARHNSEFYLKKWTFLCLRCMTAQKLHITAHSWFFHSNIKSRPLTAHYSATVLLEKMENLRANFKFFCASIDPFNPQYNIWNIEDPTWWISRYKSYYFPR